MADEPNRLASGPSPFLAGEGDAKALIRALDGSGGPLGAVEAWPIALKVATSIMLESPQAMCLAWGAQLTLIYNDAYIPFLGARHPGAMGQPLKTVWADVWTDIAPLVSKAMAGEASLIEDLHLVMARNGYPEDTWWSFSYSPIRNVDGSVGGMLDIATETTDRVTGERVQAAERVRQLALLEQMPGFVAILRGPDHVFDYVNEAYIALAGPRPYIGKSVAELFPDIDGQGFDAHLDQVYTTGESYSARGLPITFAGDVAPRFLDFLYTPIFDDNRAVTGIFVGGYDVSGSRQAQEALLQSEASLRQLNQDLERNVIQRTKARGINWQVSPDLMGALNAEGFFETSNPAWETVLGWTEAEVASISIFELLHPDDLETTRIGFQMTQIGQPAIHFPNRYRCKDGGYRWISWVGVPEDGYVYCTGRDITGERAREAELAIAREALRQSQKLEAMGQLTGGVAHDFNNLLTPIIGGLDMLTRRSVGDERERRVIDGALQSAERAKVLVQRLLAFARRQPLQATAVNLPVLVEGMADLIASTTGPNIAVRVDLQENLPLVKADANQLEMALLNLAVNARDAMPDGGVLTLGAELETVGSDHRTDLPPRDYVRLTVSDTGNGMDAETLRRAIEPFFSTKGIGKGTDCRWCTA